MSTSAKDWINNTIETSLDESESIKIFNDSSVDETDIDVYSSILEDKNYFEDCDSIFSEDVLSNDLEKSNAKVAAFTVVIIFFLFFVEMVVTILYMISANSDFQSQMIAHRLCKNFPGWMFLENMTENWCDSKVFNKEFRLEIQCPCFMPPGFQRNFTT